MGKVTNLRLRDLIGAIKDKASASKAILSKPNTVSLHLSVLRTTNHSHSAPPDEKHLAALLSLGDSSRATASALIESLMDRLHRTSNAAVALKCLLTIHHVIRRGPFILQDQLSVFPAAGGRNYLNLSGFREGATAATWVLSAWVRWYALYLETLLSTSRVIGFFLCSSSSTLEKGLQNDRLSSYLNLDLIRDVHSLATLIDETCNAPDSLLVEGNKILDEVMGLVGGDYLSAVNEILSRLGELNQRLSFLNFEELVELTRVLKRLEDCRQRLDVLFSVKKPSAESLWSLVGELKKGVGMVNVCREGEKLASVGRGEKASGSARFHDRVVECGDSVWSARFQDRVVEHGDSVRSSSARFGFNKLSLMVFDSS